MPDQRQSPPRAARAVPKAIRRAGAGHSPATASIASMSVAAWRNAVLVALLRPHEQTKPIALPKQRFNTSSLQSRCNYLFSLDFFL